MTTLRTARIRRRSIAVLLGTAFVIAAPGAPALANEPQAMTHGQAAAHRHGGAKRAPLTMAAPAPSPLPTIGQPPSDKWPGVSISLNSLHRDATGIVTLVWTVRTQASKTFGVNSKFNSDTYKYASPYVTEITLTDESAELLYHPLQVIPSSICACTSAGVIADKVTQKEPGTMYNAYKLPANVKSVTVSIKGWKPLKNVPVN